MTETFELVTGVSSTRLEFKGSLLGWSDQHTQRVVEHIIINRPGAIHQDRGPGADVYTFQVLLRDPGAAERRKAIAERLALEPFCTLIHPWLGRKPVVYMGLTVTHDMEQAINGCMAELVVTETGLRDERQESASAAARAASNAAAEASSWAITVPSLYPLTLTLEREVNTYLGLVESVASQYDLATALQRVRGASEALLSTAGIAVSRFPLVRLVRLSYGHTLEAYKQAGAALPPIISLPPVPLRMSLGRFCRSLYGGGADGIEAEMLRINNIAAPYGIPAGTVLLGPDPAAVRLDS